MIVPMIAPDGRAVLPVDAVVRSALRTYEGWKKEDFDNEHWDDEYSEPEWLLFLREHVRTVQADAFKQQYMPLLDKLNAAPCWRLWMKDVTPIWMTAIPEHEPSRKKMTPKELMLTILADAGELHPCVPWLSRCAVWFPTPQDEEVIQWGKENGMYILAIHPDSGKEVVCILPDKLLEAREMMGRHYVFMK